METFSRFMFRVARAFGIIDLRYDEETKTLDLWHKESIIYGLILKVFYMASCIYLIIHMNQENPACFGANTFAIRMSLTTDLCIIMHVVIILIESMTKREIVHRVISDFLKCLKEHKQKVMFRNGNERKNYILTSMVALAVFSKIPLGITFDVNNVKRCERAGFSHSFHDICVTLLWSLTIVIDSYVFSAFLVAYMMMDQLSDKMQKHAKELQLMQKTNLSDEWIRVWQNSLTSSILKITYQQRLIKKLLQEVVHTFWGSILFTLFNRAFQLVLALCTLFMLHVTTERTKNKIIFIIFVLLLAQSLVLLFYFGQCVTNEYRKMQRLCYEARFQLDFPRSTEEKALDQSLEALTLELQHENFRTRLFGVFNIDIATAFSTIAACFMHFLLILQTMLQFFIGLAKEDQERGWE